jgi:hypothetical protein
MKILTSEVHFDSIYRTSYGRIGSGYERGSGYCLEQNKFNRMVKRIKLFGKTIFKYVMEYELIPLHVWISSCALGYHTSDWRSKWASHPNFGKRHYGA